MQEQYRRYGAELNCLQRFDQLSTLIQFLRKNTGVAYLHKDITRFYPDLVSIPIHHLSGLVAQRSAGSRAETAVFRI